MTARLSGHLSPHGPEQFTARYVLSPVISLSRSLPLGKWQANLATHPRHLRRYDTRFIRSCRIDIFTKLYCVAELSQAVPSSQANSRRPSTSSSPHIPLSRLALADDGSHPRSRTPAVVSQTPAGHTRPHPAYSDARPASPAAHVRQGSESSYRPILPQSQYGPPYARSTPILPRHIDPNALATSGYPYAASQPPAPYQQGSQQGGAATYDPAGVDRTASATGRYECTWCGKGFTRPSSLKVSLCSD